MYDVVVLHPLPNYIGECVLVRRSDGQHYAVSSVPEREDTGKPETLAFECDENGQVTDFGAHFGGIGATREETLLQIAAGVDRHDALYDEWVEEQGGPAHALVNVLDGLVDIVRRYANREQVHNPEDN